MLPRCPPSPNLGITSHAIPDVTMFPNIQKVAKMPIMGPLFVLGMNSVKYENTTGMAAPTL